MGREERGAGVGERGVAVAEQRNGGGREGEGEERDYSPFA